MRRRRRNKTHSRMIPTKDAELEWKGRASMRFSRKKAEAMRQSVVGTRVDESKP